MVSNFFVALQKWRNKAGGTLLDDFGQFGLSQKSEIHSKKGKKTFHDFSLTNNPIWMKIENVLPVAPAFGNFRESTLHFLSPSQKWYYKFFSTLIR